jgi:hypothetical protein
LAHGDTASMPLMATLLQSSIADTTPYVARRDLRRANAY